jgi:hypothetical protein
MKPIPRSSLHQAILEEPHVRTLAHELRAAIDEVLPREFAVDARPVN